MEAVPLNVVGVRVEVPSNQPIVLLREDAPSERYLPIFVGPPEATAIVYALQGIATPRPMTHDLFTTFVGNAGYELHQVTITEVHDGTFFAEMEFTKAGESMRLSARPSDAIAMAVRSQHPVPIFAAVDVLDEASVVFDQDEESEIAEFREFLDQVAPEDFAR